MLIDLNQLREDLKKDSYGAYFGGGFGGALIDSIDLDRADPEEIVKLAVRNGINLSEYEVFED